MMRENRRMAGRSGRALPCWKQTLAILCILLGLLAGSVTAGAAVGLREGVSAISDNQVIYMGETTGRAAFDGKTAGKPIPWLVLNKDHANSGDPSGMYLASRNLLGRDRDRGGISFRNAGDNSPAWKGSNARAWCQSFYKDALSSSEQRAVLKTSLEDDGEYYTIGWNFQFDPMTLSGEKVFFLSAEEAEEYFYPAKKRVARYNGKRAIWYLRSPKETSRRDGVSAIGAVYTNGETLMASVYRVDTGYDTSGLPKEIADNVRLIQDLTRGDYAARPVFNLDKTKVLFSSAAKGGKLSNKEGVTGLKQNTLSDTNKWKLTLLDGSLKLKLGRASLEGNLLSIPYSGASTGKNRYVSGIVMNEKGRITSYGRLAAASSGTILIDTFSVNLRDTDRLYLFTEECNGDWQTDYAGKLKLVTYSKSKATNAYDEESLVPLEVRSRKKGTVAIDQVKTGAKTILLTGAAVIRTAGAKVKKPVRSILEGAFSETRAGTVEIDLRNSATKMEFEKKAFSGSKVKELILIGTGADLFQFQAGAFKESRVQSIVVKNMTCCQYRKLVRKIRKAGYSGKITNDSW